MSASPEELIVLASVYDARALAGPSLLAWERSLAGPGRPADAREVGQALYRETRLFKGNAEPAWTHLHLRSFRDLVPEDAVRPVIGGTEPCPLRVELLRPTPASYWGGPGSAPPVGNRAVSVEYIDVAEDAMGEYREIMRKRCGPAAERLLRDQALTFFHALETIAVLHRTPGFSARWNQIHLFDVDPDAFTPFLARFDAALQSVGPGYWEVFGRLDDIRRMQRWSFGARCADP